MALIKIYTEPNNLNELRAHVAQSIKLVATAALIRRGAALAGSRGYSPVPEFGARYTAPRSALQRADSPA